MTGPGRKVTPVASEFGPASVDRELAALAARQYGVVSREQIRELGLNDTAISQRSRGGRLHRVHLGVYAVGHPVLGVRGRWMAAVLACGPGAALSHASAAALWELRPSDAIYIDVTARRTGRKRPGLRIHRPRTLPPDEVTQHDGIPVTTPARTILDLAGKIAGSRLERLLDQAEIARLTDYPSLAALARAHPGHKGAGKLSRALQAHTAGTTLTRSELEERFLSLCETHTLPRPKVNERIEGREVDFFFEAARLIVETDSWRFHRTRRAFERDRTRDAMLLTHGYRTLRVTHRALESDAASVATTLKTVLAA